MRKILPLLLLLAVVLGLGAVQTSTADPAVTLAYYTAGTPDFLVINNAAGHPYCARDSAGVVRSYGIVQSPQFATPIYGAAPGPLLVNVSGTTTLVNPDTDDGWLWD